MTTTYYLKFLVMKFQSCAMNSSVCGKNSYELYCSSICVIYKYDLIQSVVTTWCRRYMKHFVKHAYQHYITWTVLLLTVNVCLQVHLHYVAVYNGGHAHRMGRYPVHFHLVGMASGSSVIGCVIFQSSNRLVSAVCE